jgi:hypothetical protein
MGGGGQAGHLGRHSRRPGAAWRHWYFPTTAASWGTLYTLALSIEAEAEDVDA